MDSQNIKVYLAISGALIVLFILVLIIPFTKKNPTQDKTTKSTNQLFPTSVETNPSPATAIFIIRDLITTVSGIISNNISLTINIGNPEIMTATAATETC